MARLESLGVRLRRWIHELAPSWWTVGAVATVASAATAFWIISLQGAVGAIERLGSPFERWMRVALLSLPLYVVGVVLALAGARRWVGGLRRPLATALATTLLISVATLGIAVAETAASSAYDFYLQTEHITQGNHFKHVTVVNSGTTPVILGDPKCDAVCVAERDTLHVHLHAMWVISLILLATHLVVIPWTIAICGGRFHRTRRATIHRPAEQLVISRTAEVLV